MWPRPRHVLLVALHLLKQSFRTLPGEAELGGPISHKRRFEPLLDQLIALLHLARNSLDLYPECLGLAPKAEAPVTPSTPASLLARAATPEDLEAIRLMGLEKEIDLELVLEKWQVSRLGEPWVPTPPGASRRAAYHGVQRYLG
jgi:hypothetical protein